MLRGFEAARVLVRRDDGAEGACGRHEEGFEREREVLEELPASVEEEGGAQSQAQAGEAAGDAAAQDGSVVR